MSRCWLVAVGLVACAGCGRLPKDPEGTLDRVQGGTLRVGLVEAPPWVVRTGGEPGGAEADLVRRLAADLGATPQWVWGGEQQHLEALERYELDLVVGGLTDDNPWKDRVGLTSQFFTDKLVVGVPGSAPLADLKGVRVEVPAGDVAAAYLRRKGAVPVPVAHPGRSGEPVAAPDWQVERLGLAFSGVDLHTRKHVLAAPPGENAWVRRLDEFLDSQRDQIKGLLQQEAARS